MDTRPLELARQMSNEIISWRRDFHMYPELAYEERRTSSIVAQKLKEWGYDVKLGSGEVGVIATMNGSGHNVLAIRADMDALPIEEVEGREYRSRVSGKMHACGHDAHTAMLLGAAKIISLLREDLISTVRLIFQPAEEGGNGALKMIEEGALDDPKVDSIYGIHVWSDLPSGKIGLREGPILAATGDITIKVRGRGGHGAHPDQTIDPIVASSAIVLSLQSIVSRNIDPFDSAVVTIGSIQGGSAFNVIPETVLMKGTYRTMRKETRELVKARIKEIAEKVASAYGASAEVTLKDVTPPTINNPEAVEIARKVAIALFGENNIALPKPSMGGEDFSYYLERVPGAFILLGTGNPQKGTNVPHHSPAFDVDEDVLYMGSALLSSLAMNFHLLWRRE
ncbi:MAG: M20 metallopeptidase family protein [Fervidicoccaceae archaeon]